MDIQDLYSQAGFELLLMRQDHQYPQPHQHQRGLHKPANTFLDQAKAQFPQAGQSGAQIGQISAGIGIIQPQIGQPSGNRGVNGR